MPRAWTCLYDAQSAGASIKVKSGIGVANHTVHAEVVWMLCGAPQVLNLFSEHAGLILAVSIAEAKLTGVAAPCEA